MRWRAGELDRLLDEGYADIVGRVTALLAVHGWQVFPEVTFSEYGERGSIDVLAWHEASRTLLVVEVKTEIASAEELLRRHDVKVRLAARIARTRLGLDPRAVGRLLVIDDGSTTRRRVARLAPVLDRVYPTRGRDVTRWLGAPSGEIGGILLVAADERARVRRRIRPSP